VTKANKNRAKKNQANNISEDWYQERIRETKASFNLAISLAATTAIFGLGAGVSLVAGNVSVTTATTAASIVSGVASRRAFKLYEKASKSLDETARKLLDDS
jgi:hypothetical protein